MRCLCLLLSFHACCVRQVGVVLCAFIVLLLVFVFGRFVGQGGGTTTGALHVMTRRLLHLLLRLMHCCCASLCLCLCVCVCLCLCLSAAVCLSLCVCLRPVVSIFLFVSPWFCLSVPISVCLCLRGPVCVFLSLSPCSHHSLIVSVFVFLLSVSVCLSVCLFVGLPVRSQRRCFLPLLQAGWCLAGWVAVCLPVRPASCLFVILRVFVCLFALFECVCQWVCLSACVFLSVGLSVCLLACLVMRVCFRVCMHDCMCACMYIFMRVHMYVHVLFGSLVVGSIELRVNLYTAWLPSFHRQLQASIIKSLMPSVARGGSQIAPTTLARTSVACGQSSNVPGVREHGSCAPRWDDRALTRHHGVMTSRAFGPAIGDRDTSNWNV